MAVTARHWLVLSAASLIVLGAHAVTLPATLEDEDSVNMALGVEDFNIGRHQPHPPGYPVYIAAAKASTAVVSAIKPDWSRDRKAAAGLAWLSILTGAAGVFVLAWWWGALGVPPTWAVAVACVTAVTPLYWFSAARPLTDTPGMCLGLAVQAAALVQMRATPASGAWWRWSLIGVVAGLAIGVRTQTLWLSLPALLVACIQLLRSREHRAWLGLVAGSVLGCLVWAVPMLIITGGLDRYLSLLRSQGRQDVTGVAMLATQPSWNALLEDLRYTFIVPWQDLGLPLLVLALAAAGLWRLGRWRGLSPVWVLWLTLPYLAFHVLFQEVETIRYALPTVAVTGGLAALALAWLGTRVGPVAAAVATIAGFWWMMPVTQAYTAGAPVFLALDQVRADAGPSALPRIEAHHRAWWAATRALEYRMVEWPINKPRLVAREETMRLVEFWRSGATETVWFLADPTRSDLARFDPRTTIPGGQPRFDARVRGLVAGLRVYEIDWWRLSPPFWMLGRGWALSPELAGEAPENMASPAYVRRHGERTRAVITARVVDPAAGLVVETAVGDDVIDRWPLASAPERQVRWVEWASSGNDASPYTTVTLTVRDGAGTLRPDAVQFEGFDAAPAAMPLVALGTGWSRALPDTGPRGLAYEASAAAELLIRHGGQRVRLTVRGHLTLDATSPVPVLISCGATLLGEIRSAGDFAIDLEVTPAQLDAAGGLIVVATPAPSVLRLRDAVAGPALAR